MADTDLKDALDVAANTSATFKSKQVPAGGTTGQRLQKNSNADYDVGYGSDPDYTDTYAAKTHDHDLAYAALTHDHSGTYLETESDPVAMLAIGTRTYTEQNVVTNSEAVALSINALDVAMGDIDTALALIMGEDIDADTE